MKKMLKYPILAIGKGNVIDFARHEKDLTTCTRTGYKNGWYKGLQIIDNSGKKFKVKEANIVGYVGPFWGMSLFSGQRLKVELEFLESEEEISLNDFIVRLTKIMENDRYFWNSDGEYDSRIDFIRNATSIKEIIEKLTIEFYDKK